MTPDELAESLKMLASYIEAEPNPSVSFVSSSLRHTIAAVETEDPMVKIAIFKNLWRKVVNTKGERKVLDKIDKLEKLKKVIPKLSKLVSKGEDLADLTRDEIMAGALFMALERISGGSKELNSSIPDDADGIVGFADHMDEWWLEDGDDDEEGDRDAIESALKSLESESNERISDFKKRLDRLKNKGKKPKEKFEAPLKKGERGKPEDKESEEDLFVVN